jgi:hypothetical protein
MPAASSKVYRTFGFVARETAARNANPARLVALGLCEQIVVPFAIGLGAEKGILPVFPHDLNVTFSSLSVDGIEPMLFTVDNPNGCFASDSPLFSEISDVRDVFVFALVVWLIDACYVIFCHNYPLCTAFTSLL